MIWRLINTGLNSGKFNMDLDESLARTFDPGAHTPILRLYGWRPYAISLGFNQKEDDFDAAKIAASGYDIVRRPTGGRAIFHAHELTYSVVTPVGETGPREIYHSINKALLRGLSFMKIDAELTAENADFRDHYQSAGSIPCFSSSAKHEIHYRGKKLIGSAQRRFGKTILQHGSFLLGTEHRRLISFLKEGLPGEKEPVGEPFESKSTEAELILGRDVSFDEAAEYIVKGFQAEFGVTWENIPGESVPKILNLKEFDHEKK